MGFWIFFASTGTYEPPVLSAVLIMHSLVTLNLLFLVSTLVQKLDQICIKYPSEQTFNKCIVGG